MNPDSIMDHYQLFRAGLNMRVIYLELIEKGEETFTPRLVMIDAKGLQCNNLIIRTFWQF